jgi:hypothetical protein
MALATGFKKQTTKCQDHMIWLQQGSKRGIVQVDNRSYGNAFLTYYRREEAAL